MPRKSPDGNHCVTRDCRIGLWEASTRTWIHEYCPEVLLGEVWCATVRCLRSDVPEPRFLDREDEALLLFLC